MKNKVFILFILIFLSAIAGAYFLYINNGPKVDTPARQNISPGDHNEENSENYYEKNTAQWKTFTSDELGLSLKYPPKYEYIKFNITDHDREPYAYPEGKSFKGLFCTADPCSRGSYISFGGITTDFSAPRSANMWENHGYIKKEGTYYKKFFSRENEIDYNIEEIIIEGATGIIIFGDNRNPAPGTIGEGSHLVIFNFPVDSEFPAVSFTRSRISFEEFKDILGTVIIE